MKSIFLPIRNNHPRLVNYHSKPVSKAALLFGCQRFEYLLISTPIIPLFLANSGSCDLSSIMVNYFFLKFKIKQVDAAEKYFPDKSNQTRADHWYCSCTKQQRILASDELKTIQKTQFTLWPYTSLEDAFRYRPQISVFAESFIYILH